jgi:hypothetical protein
MTKNLENKVLDVAKKLANEVFDTGYTVGAIEQMHKDDVTLDLKVKEAYQQGLKEAWEATRKMYQFNPNTNEQLCEELYDMRFNEFICTVSASEAVEKIKEFEKKGTCNKCVRSNTCVHKHEDIICFGCVNGSEYEEEPKQTEKRCEDCKNLFIDGYSTVCLIRKAACCVNKDKWEPKQPEQTEEQPKQSCEDCVNKNTCSLKCPEHVKANGCRSWVPEQTNDKINLGDEVIHETGSKGIVVGIGNGKLYLLMRDYDMPQKVSKEGYTKTGRHFSQIQELRNQLS